MDASGGRGGAGEGGLCGEGVKTREIWIGRWGVINDGGLGGAA